MQLAVGAAQERPGDSIRRVLQRQEVVGAPAQEAARDRVIRVAGELGDPAIVDGGEDGASVGAVAVAGGAAELGHLGRA